jgi:hypothetical protein
MVSHLLPFMADITHSHCFEYISMAIALIVREAQKQQLKQPQMPILF